MWILKPTNLFGGKGIEIIKDIDALKKKLTKSKQNSSSGE
jgi:hypothetical protein